MLDNLTKPVVPGNYVNNISQFFHQTELRQIAKVLTTAYKKSPNPSVHDMAKLAEALKIPLTLVKKWFDRMKNREKERKTVDRLEGDGSSDQVDSSTAASSVKTEGKYTIILKPAWIS